MNLIKLFFNKSEKAVVKSAQMQVEHIVVTDYLPEEYYNNNVLKLGVDGEIKMLPGVTEDNYYKAGDSTSTYLWKYLTFGITEEFSLNQLIFNIFCMLYEFIVIHNALKITVMLTLLVIYYTKLMYIMVQMLYHEKSKKIFFGVYVLAISYIIPFSLLIITSFCDKSTVEAILLVYIYMTAVLMLFLIFLALTTCESYFNKDGGIFTHANCWYSFFFKCMLIGYPIFYMYYMLVYDLSMYYCMKYKILRISDINNISYEEYKIMEGIKPNVKKKLVGPVVKCVSDGTRYGHKWVVCSDPVNVKSISIFEVLKRELRDTYLGYFLSAVLQACALILIILSLII